MFSKLMTCLCQSCVGTYLTFSGLLDLLRKKRYTTQKIK